MLHPAVQHKAQSELDKVIGRDRLPDFEDRPQLPYLDCVFKENLRWKVVTPLGKYFSPNSIEVSESDLESRRRSTALQHRRR